MEKGVDMSKPAIGALVLLVGSAVLGATVFREQIARAAPPITSVFVTNDVSQPVPVQQQGTADVRVTNNVLTVRELQAAPFQDHFQFTFSGTGGETVQYTVPDGRRLRIDLVTLHDLGGAPGFKHFIVTPILNGTAVDHYLASSTQASDGDVVTQPVTLYADGGTVMRFALQLSAPLGTPGSPVQIPGSFAGALEAP
jgi:hypothetical protein